VEYSSDQAEAHIQKHLSTSVKLSQSAANFAQSPTKHSHNPTASTQSNPTNTTVYPMVEPLEFWTHELSQVSQRDSYHIDHQ
jgi:hypothetical protein